MSEQSGPTTTTTTAAADHHVRADDTHNRWHPDVPPVATVRPGETVLMDFREGTDGVINSATRAGDLAGLTLDTPHAMTGPVYVEGAEPGDVLEIEVLALETDGWGFTFLLPGFGMLGHRIEAPYIVHWELGDGFARSEDMPGIAIPAAPFLGLAGVAPSAAQLAAWTAREAQLLADGHAVFPPLPSGAKPAIPSVAEQGLRTIAPRENGGNMDVKELGPGGRMRVPVAVPGALFSAGDVHFAQGDGESCGVAIETGGRGIVRFTLEKAADLKFRPRYPMFVFDDRAAGRRDRTYLATSGLPIRDDGSNAYLDTTLAAREALDELVDYLRAEEGLSIEQAAILVSVAADLRISEIVDLPNPLVTAALPLDVFEDA